MKNKQEWVSCKDNLPKELQDVLVFKGTGRMCVDCIIDGKWEKNEWDYLAWMPLPQPYKK